ncbi:MAG: alpha/beta fold hydrolase [Methanosarcinales archaeon]|nr:alpha/beta fold hydrolase [Methanosarcinales archaeon]
MKRSIVIFVIILSVFGLGCTSQNDNIPDQDDEGTIPADQQDIQGIWQGVIEVSGTKLRLVINISSEQNSTLTATLDSPDQGVTGIPIDKVTFQNDNLNLEVESIHGVYNGKFGEDDQTINGHWEQSGQSFPLLLQRLDKAPVLNRPQEPDRPYPYEDEEVIYKNETTGIELAGTLTLPTSEGPFPAVLLITGSGAQDRNETILGHRPFLVLSDYLTRRGIAVLRVDDRGIGGSTGNVSQATSEDFAGDVLTGVEYLKGHKEIDSEKIGLIGHSEGGIIAPMAAVRSGDVAFIVMMGGPGVAGEEILYLQTELLLRSEGVSDDEIAKEREVQSRIFDVVKNETDNAAAEKKLNEILDEIEMPKENKLAEIERCLSPWFRYYLTYDPKPTLINVQCPVLAIIGEKDLQVPSRQNLPAIEEALRTGGNKDYTIMELPGLNHLFQTAITGSPSEYQQIEETLSPTALEVIGDWILQHTENI